MGSALDNSIEALKGIGTPECEKWRSPIFRRYRYFGAAIAKHYRLVEQDLGYVAANQWLTHIEIEMKIGDTNLFLDSPAEEIWEYSKAAAPSVYRELNRASNTLGIESAIVFMKKKLATTGILINWPERLEKDQLVSLFARLCSPNWWNQQLSKVRAQRMEFLCIKMGLVGKAPGSGLYISDFNYERYLFSMRQNRKFLELTEVVNEEDQAYTLAELSDLNISNPVIRRGELMMRIRGAEEHAEALGHKGLFLTITAPSKYHAMTICDGKAVPNPKYQGYTPKQSQAYLNKQWQRARAKLARKGIHTYGFRVVEPHHDGCPHWHLLLFVAPEHSDDLIAICRQYALAEDGDETGAAEYRFKVVEINPAEGTASGYIAKYISKGIDGHAIDKDLYGAEAKTSASRIKAWASTWDIRQFQSIGMPSVTVWRELRRLSADDIEPELLHNATKAADNGDWLTYVELMGGMNCAQNDRPIRPLHVQKKEENLYGEFTKQLKGIIYASKPFISRPHTWIKRKLKSNQSAKSEASELDAITTDQAATNTLDLRAPPLTQATLDLCQ